MNPAHDDISSMSVRQLREELHSLGISTADCIEKSDFVSKLDAARQSSCRRAEASSSADPLASFASGFQNAMNTVSASFQGMSDQIAGRFNVLDAKLDRIEKNREILQQRLSKPPSSAFGRLNQLKVQAEARELDAQLQAAQKHSAEERARARSQVSAATASALGGLAK